MLVWHNIYIESSEKERKDKNKNISVSVYLIFFVLLKHSFR